MEHAMRVRFVLLSILVVPSHVLDDGFPLPFTVRQDLRLADLLGPAAFLVLLLELALVRGLLGFSRLLVRLDGGLAEELVPA